MKSGTANDVRLVHEQGWLEMAQGQITKFLKIWKSQEFTLADKKE